MRFVISTRSHLTHTYVTCDTKNICCSKYFIVVFHILSKDGIDIGYAKLVDKHINKYERIFEENERNFNKYKQIEEVITITDDSDNGIEEECEDNRYKRIEEAITTITGNNDLNRNSDEMVVKSVQKIIVEKQQQTVTIIRNEENSINTDVHKPTHKYTCEWFTCRYVTNDYRLLKRHLHNKHVKTQTCRHYSRSFVSLNVYQYKCLHCDYNTKTHETIVSHVCEHNQCKRFATNNESQKWSCDECGRSFPAKRQLTCHTKRHKPRKCFTKYCGKMFTTKEELLSHKKIHIYLNCEVKRKVSACDTRLETKRGPTSHEKQHNFVTSNSKQDHNTAPMRPYFCQYRKCGSSFRTKHHLTVHQKRCHKKDWKCLVGQRRKRKRFVSKHDLAEHKILHYCVFQPNSIEYLKSVGVCGFRNISRFFEKRKVIDTSSDANKVRFRYLCLWSECAYNTLSYKPIQRHIHDTHTCPYQLRAKN